MIISPPFLPKSVIGETDEAYLERAMVGGIPGDGGYPLSFDLNWHGGVHLTAPSENGVPLPVCAIADGYLVYYRKPTIESSSAPGHPLRYSDKWTDDGCVIIKHETDIGEGAEAKIVYYSIYMHLSKISISALEKGKLIYRKEPIGEAGSIYGKQGVIHFEIIASDKDVKKIIGRDQRDLSFKTNDGRKDCVWGDMYFFIPPEVLVYQSPPQSLLSPQNSSPIIFRFPTMPSGPAPVSDVVSGDSTSNMPNEPNLIGGYDWATAAELQEGLFIQMSYDRGECKLTTFSHSGYNFGETAESSEYEYGLYATATSTFTQSPSAGYELLRFGRVLGQESLLPSDSAHWRKIKVPNKAGESHAVGWVNLNSATITKFSDADFPHWQGWQLVNDDDDADSHCQSRFIRDLLSLDIRKIVSDNSDAVAQANTPSYEQLSSEQKQKLSEQYVAERDLNRSKLESKEVQVLIKRLICRFPSEWSKNDFDTHYGWLLRVAENGPMPQDAYQKLKAHQLALGFWEDASLSDIDSKHWHFPPKEFIAMFRKCSWLSRNELLQLLPMNSLRKTGATFARESVNASSAGKILSSSDADSLIRRNELNKALRKFLVVTPARLACFLGNATQETQWYQKLAEGSPYWYKPWDGRGYLQLTHASNYIKYWGFKGVAISAQVSQVLAAHTTMAQNNRPMVNGVKSMYDPTNSLSDTSTGIPQSVISLRGAVENSYDAANSAGAYWAWSGASESADSYYADPTSLIMSVSAGNAGTKHYYRNTAFGNVAATVNLGHPSTNFNSIWGVQARFLAFTNAQIVLMDRLEFKAPDGSIASIPEDFVARRINQ